MPLLATLETSPATPAIGSVIWLHGLGANGHDFAPIATALNLPAWLPLRFIFPHAPKQPVTINQGHIMPAWYDILSMGVERHADEAGIATSVRQIHDLIAQEEARGIPSTNVILAGFSQGAVIALHASLCYPKKLRGTIALSGYLPQASRVLEETAPANKELPIFIGHGISDTVVPCFLGESLQKQLTQAHFAVSWHRYPMAHSVCGEEIEDIAQWIQRVFDNLKSED